MKTNRLTVIPIIFIIGICLCFCKSKEATSGEIHGIVMDAITNQPIMESKVTLNLSEDSIGTASDGTYLFGDLIPGSYEIRAAKQGYAGTTKSVEVTPGTISELNFSLNKIEVPALSDKYLDFGSDQTVKNLTFSYTGTPTLNYTITADHSWISVTPSSGGVSNKSEVLTITVNRTGLAESIQRGEITINSLIGQEVIKNTVTVLLNGVMDHDFNYYSVVRMGDQTWMGSNLNVGTLIGGGNDQSGTQIKKYNYSNNDAYGSIYGGLYTRAGMMRGSDGTERTQGVCPVGWHIPTLSEWDVMLNLLDVTVAGAKIKETGTSHWQEGNVATNESGFTALPGGIWDGMSFSLISSHAYFWTTSGAESSGYDVIQLGHNTGRARYQKFVPGQAAALRCVKD